MTPEQQKSFMAQLQATARLFRRSLTDDTVEVYTKALPADLEFVDLIAALDRLARTAEAGAAFPLPRALAQLARGSWHHPARNLTDLEADRVHQHVFAAMAAWERDGHGSARAAFHRAWGHAVAAEGLRDTPVLALARNATWQAWLAGGLPLTRERMVELLADAAPHAAPTLLRGLRDLVAQIERGDVEHPLPGVLSTLAQAVATVIEREEPPPRRDEQPAARDERPIPRDEPPEPEPPPPLAANDDGPAGPTWEVF